jgi:hypothetical protein
MILIIYTKIRIPLFVWEQIVFFLIMYGMSNEGNF